MVVTIKTIAWLFAISVWAALGFYVWVPALIIIILFYVCGALVSSFGSDTFLRFSEKRLEKNAALYSDGFIRISRGIWSSSSKDEIALDVAWADFCKYILLAFLYLALATLIWVLLFSLTASLFEWPANYFDRISEFWNWIKEVIV